MSVEPDHERVLADGALDGVPWAVVVSSQGARVTVGRERQPVGVISTETLSLGFGPWSIGYAKLGQDRRVVMYGTTIPALRRVRIETVGVGDVEVVVVHSKNELGVNVYVALPRSRPTKVIATTEAGDGAFLDVEHTTRRFRFPDE